VSTAKTSSQTKVLIGKGITTGVGVCLYFKFIFDANELVQDRFKKTDEQIEKMVQKEFPHKPSMFTFSGPNKTKTINEYRQKYNSGKLLPTRKLPPKYCFRYNSEGVVVDGKTGTIPLDPKEIFDLQSLHMDKLNSDK